LNIEVIVTQHVFFGEPAGGFVEDRGEDEKRVRRVSSSDAAA